MKRGYVCLWRKTLSSLVFGNEKCLKIWIWCLLRANHQDKTFLLGRNKITINKGQFVMGLNKSKEELNLAVSTIHYWVNFLESEGMVKLKKTNKYTIITILNWEDYQEVKLKKNSNDNSNETLKETNNNDKALVSTKNTIVAKATDVPFVSSEWINKCCADKQDHIHLIGNYMKIKKMDFPTKKTAEAELRRNMKVATLLKDYPPERRKKALVEANKMTNQWTLETILKYLNK